MLKLGTNNIDKIMLGTNAVDKVMLGTNQVYPSAGDYPLDGQSITIEDLDNSATATAMITVNSDGTLDKLPGATVDWFTGTPATHTAHYESLSETGGGTFTGSSTPVNITANIFRLVKSTPILATAQFNLIIKLGAVVKSTTAVTLRARGDGS